MRQTVRWVCQWAIVLKRNWIFSLSNGRASRKEFPSDSVIGKCNHLNRVRSHVFLKKAFEFRINSKQGNFRKQSVVVREYK